MTIIKKLEDYKLKIEGWAEERNIYNDSNIYKQLVKLGEESAELFVALNKKDEKEIKDAIGDIFVCIINAGRFLNEDVLSTFKIPEAHYEFMGRANEENLNNYMFLTLMLTTKESPQWLRVLPIVLYAFCDNKGIDFIECIDMAWNTIKDRKGKMINGKFVKDE